MMLLEREEYLKSAKEKQEYGNGSYLRNFKSLQTNSLSIRIPPSRSRQFKPILIELINRQKEQVAELSYYYYTGNVYRLGVLATLCLNFLENQLAGKEQLLIGPKHLIAIKN